MIEPSHPDFPAFTVAADAALCFWAAIHLADSGGAPAQDCVAACRTQLERASEALDAIEDPVHLQVAKHAVAGMSSALQAAEQAIAAPEPFVLDAQFILEQQHINIH